MQATDPQETILKLSSLNDQIYNDIEQLTNELKNRKSDAMALAKEGDEILVHLMRVTGTLCALFMVSREYNKAEMLLKRSATFLNENNEYKSLVADLYYWQEKYELAASHYANMESPSDKDTSNLVLSLIRSNQTQKAESILQFLQQSNPTLLSIVNLHIAALYCSNNNYEFGISRMLSVMTPLLNTLNKKTWLHVKRCLVRLHREQSLGTVMISDDLVSNIVKMLKECVLHGANLDAVGEVSGGKTNKIGAEATTLLKEFEKMLEFI